MLVLVIQIVVAVAWLIQVVVAVGLIVAVAGRVAEVVGPVAAVGLADPVATVLVLEQTQVV